MNVVAAGVLVAVFGAVMLRQVLGRGPPVWVAFGIGAVATVGLEVLSPIGAFAALVAATPVILFLFALFVFARALERAGAIDHLARWLLGRAPSPRDLPAVLFVGFGVASAFLLNDALVLLGVPLLLGVARRLRVAATPLLLTLAFAVSVGSVATPFGNPQNLLIASASGLSDPVATFLRYLLVPTAINLALGAWYLRRVFAARLAEAAGATVGTPEPRVPFWPRGGWTARLASHPALAIFPVTLGVVVGTSLLAPIDARFALPSWMVALGGAVLVLALSAQRGPIVRRVNGTVLLLFVGLFVVVAGAVAGGVVPALEGIFPIPAPGATPGALGAIVLTSLLGPQLVSNVPWVALQIPVLAHLGYGGSTPLAWMALAGASTLAGNVTLLGAASNLIVAEVAEKDGSPVRLGEFVRYALPLAAMTTAVLFVTLWLGW